MTRRSTFQLLVGLLSCATILSAVGCHSLRADVTSLLDRSDIATATEADDAQPPPDEQSAKAAIVEKLGLSAWRSMPSEIVQPGQYRWRNEAVDALCQDSAEPDLADALKSENTIAKANAVIVAARRGDDGALPELAKVIADSNLDTNQRCAAIETLSSFDSRAALLIADLLNQSASADQWQPALEAELLSSAGMCQVAVASARLESALRNPAPEVRIAALDYHAARRVPLDQRGLDLRTDPDPRVRLQWIDTVASVGGDTAASELGKCLRFADLPLRLAAIHALGKVSGDEARSLLHAQLQDPGELIRAAATESLAEQGDESAILDAAVDPSWRVRKIAAQSLARFPTRQGVGAAEQLLTDQSPDVEVAVVESLAAWPLARSGPLLLKACGQPALTTRQRAADHLARQWPRAGEFTATAPPERRAALLAELQEAWNSEFGIVDRSQLSEAASAGVNLVALAPRLDEIRVLVSEIATQRSTEVKRRQLARLRSYDRELLPALEHLAVNEQLHLVDEIYREVLPALDPVFRQLAALESSDLQARREAASRLSALAAHEPLRPLAYLRLAQRMPREDDTLVWLSIWHIVERDAREPAVRIAYAALDHRDVEVRRRACEYLGQFPAPKHGEVLARALSDHSANVARAAAVALGRCGPLDDTLALQQALAARDPELRFLAAISLAQLGFTEGYAALERITYEGDIERRRAAAVAMGNLRDQRFVPALIRLLDDRDNVRRAAVDSLVRIIGPEVSQPPGESVLSLPEQAQRWKAWWDQQQATPARQP